MNPDEFYNQAIGLLGSNNGMAYRLLSAAVEANPSHGPAWYVLGNASNDLGLKSASIAQYRRACEAEPNNPRHWANLGHTLYHNGDMAGAREATERSIELAPNEPEPWCNLSLIESVEGNLADSLKHALGARSLKSGNTDPEIPGDPAVDIAVGFAYLYNREWIDGLKWYEAKYRYKLTHFLDLPYPKWTGGRVEKLFVGADQGMGDTLSFARFIPEVSQRVGQVLLQIQPELLRLFTGLFAHLENVTVAPLGPPFPEADAWTTIMSLPVPLGLTDREFEQAKGLKLPSTGLTPRPVWKAPNRKLHVGICWAGNPDTDIERWRRAPVDLFLDLYKIPGIQLYSLQVGPSRDDLSRVGSGNIIKDLSPYIRDVTDTISLIRDLDLVITIETSLGHICGLMDAECWVLSSRYGGDFRVGRSGEKPIWYKRHKIFRQGEDAQWEPVMERVQSALKARIG